MNIGHAVNNQQRLKRAIRRLVKAEVAYSWMGSQPSEERRYIQKELTLARNNLNKIIAQIIL